MLIQAGTETGNPDGQMATLGSGISDKTLANGRLWKLQLRVSQQTQVYKGLFRGSSSE